VARPSPECPDHAGIGKSLLSAATRVVVHRPEAQHKTSIPLMPTCSRGILERDVPLA
jgi:hypothetical protein